MTAIDELVANSEKYAASFPARSLPSGQRLAVLACMDARLHVYEVLGLRRATRM